MKKILGLTIAALLVMALVGGGTWAYFSDVETATGNILTGGTLNLQIGTAQILSWASTADDVYPGRTGSGSSTLVNAGTLDGELDIDFDTSVINTESTDTDDLGTTYDTSGSAEDGDTAGELGDAILMAVYIDADGSDWNSSSDIGLVSTIDTYYSWSATVTATDADAATVSTLTDATLIGATTDFYKDMIVVIDSDTGAGQWRKITAFNETTDTITVSPDFTITPDTTSDFTVTSLKYYTVESYEDITWDDVYTGTMPVGTDTLFLDWKVPQTAANEIQGDSVTFDISFILEQTAVD